MFKKLLWKSNKHPKAKLPCVAIQLWQCPRHHLSLPHPIHQFNDCKIRKEPSRCTIIKAYVWIQFLTCTKTLFFADQSLLLRLRRYRGYSRGLTRYPALAFLLLYIISVSSKCWEVRCTFYPRKGKKLLANRWWLGRVGIFALPVCSFLELPKEARHSIATGYAHTTRWKTGFPPALSIFTLCQQQL